MMTTQPVIPPKWSLPSRPQPLYSNNEETVPLVVVPEQVKVYLDWFANRQSFQGLPEERRIYQQEALLPISQGEHEVLPYMTLPIERGASTVMTLGQKMFLLGVGIYLAISLVVLHMMMLTFLLGIVTTFYLIGLTMSVLLSYRVHRRGVGVTIDQQDINTLDTRGVVWPTYTVLCPMYHEVPAVPLLVESMKSLSYPSSQLQVFFITQEDDTETIAALTQSQLPPFARILVMPKASPQTKARACNYGLIQATGEFVTIFDAEDRPDPYQLKKVVLTFAQSGETTACVQAKLDIYNTEENAITRWFTSEYNTWWNIVAPGFLHLGLALPLGGSSNHIRADVLRALGGWDAFNVTEDCDLGIRLSAYGFTSEIVNSTTYEEAPTTFSVWMKQRSRWIKGYIQTYLVHTREPIKAMRKYGVRTTLSLHLIVGCLTALLFLNPLMWILSTIYVIWQPVALYHELFPPPLLYVGSLCFIFGNFFFIYLHLMGCLSRGRYYVMKYTLLLPFYWFLMPIPAYLALFQLLSRPFYWAKTPHTGTGQSFQGSSEWEIEHTKISSTPTQLVRAVRLFRHPSLLFAPATPTERVAAIYKSGTKRKQATLRREKRSIDWYCISIMLIALIASIFTTVHSFMYYEILLNQDAIAHLWLSRDVFDSLTPGLAQLGVDWLPLPQLIMIPFTWNDYLWRTGLAGSIPSMCCYLLATLYIYRFAKRLSHSNLASAVATLAFVCNPNVLYLQTTPLSEPVCIATITITSYYFFSWIQDGKTVQLFLTAIWVFLATLARYDGWALFCILLVAIPLVGILRHFSIRKIESTLLVYTPIAGLGIILWMVWNWLLEGSPLHFEHGPTSSWVQVHGGLGGTFTTPFTDHNLWQSIRAYTLVSIQNIGGWLALVALVALMYILLKNRLSTESIGILILLTPFLFYVVSFYTGDVTARAPGIVPTHMALSSQFYNTRFGSEMVAPVAIILATLVADIFLLFHKCKRNLSYIVMTMSVALLLGLIGVQTYTIVASGTITLEEGQYNSVCEVPNSLDTFFAKHYDGGRILYMEIGMPFDLNRSNLDGKDVIWEGSYQLWQKALANPASQVNWVVVNPTNPTDLVTQHINIRSTKFLAQFSLVMKSPGGAELFRKKRLPPLPIRPIPSYLATEITQYSQYCGTGKLPPREGW